MIMQRSDVDKVIKMYKSYNIYQNTKMLEVACENINRDN